jgi:methylated-DNA-protein-cysteine methyltransferase-like protein
MTGQIALQRLLVACLRNINQHNDTQDLRRQRMPVDPADAVYEFVRTIPTGKVVTYGQVAQMVTGVALNPRQVGGIMIISPPDVPWQRVVGAGGHLPIGKRSPHLKNRQSELLEQEGVYFLPNGCVDMARSQWMADGEPAQSGLFDDV